MMKNYQIEDTVIAYLDGRLTDVEGAELLHRVSVSPEIREIYEQHELLRSMSFRAARNVSVAPELEDALFKRINAMQHEEKLPAGFWSMRKISTTAAVIAVALAGLLSSSEFRT